MSRFSNFHLVAEIPPPCDGAGNVVVVDYSGCARRFLVATNTGVISLFNAAAPPLLVSRVAMLKVNIDRINQRLAAAAMSEDGARFAVGFTNGSVKVYDALMCVETHHFAPTANSAVFSVAFSRCGKFLATGCFMGHVRVFDLESKTQISERTGTVGLIRVVFAGDGRAAVLSASRNDTIRVTSAVDGSLLLQTDIDAQEVSCLSVSDDGERFAVGELQQGLGPGTARVFSSADGSELQRLASHRGGVYAVPWADDDHVVISGGADGRVVVSDVASAEQLAQLDVPGGSSVYAVGVSPDGGRRIVAGCHDGFVRVFSS